MATTELIHLTPSPNHPMANPGYGKRAVPGQLPPAADDFAHLPVREASIAALIDMLVEGAVISGKALAAAHPLYGQAACLTALNALSTAGHLRRVRERLDSADGSCRWVTRTYFSRTPHDDAWWQAFCANGVAPAPQQPPADPPPPADRPPAPSEPPRTVAYDALAHLGRHEPRLTLSAADCAHLAPLAAEWLSRDPSRERFTTALTTGLPDPLHSPSALLRSRLQKKLPPLPAPPTVMECTQCGDAFSPKLLQGGLCPDCRGAPPSPQAAEADVRIDIRPYMDDMRAAVRNAKGTHRT